MSMMDHTSNVLAAPSREFPLAARLERLPDEACDTFGEIVVEWYGPGVAPRQDKFNQDHLAAPEASIDATVMVLIWNVGAAALMTLAGIAFGRHIAVAPAR